jgi:hypothetical protein
MVSEGLTKWKCFERDGATASFRGLAQPVAAQTVVIPAEAGIQYVAAFAIEPRLPWNTGSPAFAGDDGCKRSG